MRRIDATTGIVTTVAGNSRYDVFVGEDVPATSVSLNPLSIAIDGDRLLVATDGGVRIVDLRTGLIRSVAGFPTTCGASQASCVFATDIELDRAGRLVTAEPDMHAIRRIVLR